MKTTNRIVLVSLVVSLTGCATLQKVADYHEGACELLGEEQRATVEPLVKAHAERVGISIPAAWALWKTSCQARHLGADGVAMGKAGAGAPCAADPFAVPE